MKIKLMIQFILPLFCLFLAVPVLAMDYEDLNSVKEPAYRVGTTDDVEQKANFVKKLDMQTVKEIDPFENIEKLSDLESAKKQLQKVLDILPEMEEAKEMLDRINLSIDK